jgi:hypothetical protein
MSRDCGYTLVARWPSRHGSARSRSLAEPTRSGWGYGFSFRDPEANVWGVAVKYGSDFDDRGGFIYP